jgi:hypothetical protein
MTEHVAQVPLRRSLDRSRRRKPLRLGISRRAAGHPAGRDGYVTQVRVGKKSALLLPLNTRARPPAPQDHPPLPPRRTRSVEP